MIGNFHGVEVVAADALQFLDVGNLVVFAQLFSGGRGGITQPAGGTVDFFVLNGRVETFNTVHYDISFQRVGISFPFILTQFIFRRKANVVF